MRKVIIKIWVGMEKVEWESKKIAGQEIEREKVGGERDK